MLHQPFYDPAKTYEENFNEGPFGAFQDGEVYRSAGEPRFDFLGFKVNSPFGIPAGPLLNGNFVKAALDKGFDVATYKTVRSEKYPCHPWPNVVPVKVEGELTLEKAKGKLVADRSYQEPISITNSFGVPSFGPEFWQKDLAQVVRQAGPGQIVVGSFQGTKKEGQTAEEYINDYKVAAGLIKNTGVKVIEVNLSCPNEGTNNLLCYDAERSRKVCEVIKSEIGDTPLVIKIAYYEDLQALKNFVERVAPYVAAISAINTIAAEIVDPEGNQALPGEGRLRSGVCGASIKWAGLDMVKKLEAIRREGDFTYKIIGVGGVTAPADYFEYIEAGADAVLSATGAMWNPYLAKEIKEKLE